MLSEHLKDYEQSQGRTRMVSEHLKDYEQSKDRSRMVSDCYKDHEQPQSKTRHKKLSAGQGCRMQGFIFRCNIMGTIGIMPRYCFKF